MNWKRKMKLTPELLAFRKEMDEEEKRDEVERKRKRMRDYRTPMGKLEKMVELDKTIMEDVDDLNPNQDLRDLMTKKFIETQDYQITYLKLVIDKLEMEIEDQNVVVDYYQRKNTAEK